MARGFSKPVGKYRSKFEADTAKDLKTRKVKAEYEQKKLKYKVPSSNHTYTVDFELPNGIIVETKGLLTLEDRKKMVLVRDQHPELDIRFLFMSANRKLYKGSKTTYGQWCTKNGFLYASKTIPKEWLS